MMTGEMRVALLLAFVAHLGVSLASPTKVIDTGAEKTVPELMAIYESFGGGVVPGSLLARRQALSLRSEAGDYQDLTDGHIAGLWPNDGSISGGLKHTFDSVGDLPYKDFVPKGLNSPDSSHDGSLSSAYYSIGARNEEPIEGFVSGGSKPRDGRTTGGLPHAFHSIGTGQLSPEGFIAGGRKPHDGSSHGGVLHSDNIFGGDLGSLGHIGAGGSKSRDGRTTGGLPYNLHSVGAGQQSPKDVIASGRKPQVDSLHGGLSSDEDSTAGSHNYVPTYYPIGGGVSSDGLVAGGRKWHDGATTGGFARTYDLVGGGTNTGVGAKIPTYGLVGDGVKYTDGLIGGGLSLRVGPGSRGRAYTDYYSEGDGLVSANDLTFGVQVPSSAAGKVTGNVYHGSNVLPQTKKSQGLASQDHSGLYILDEVNTNVQPRASRESKPVSFGYPQTGVNPLVHSDSLQGRVFPSTHRHFDRDNYFSPSLLDIH